MKKCNRRAFVAGGMAASLALAAGCSEETSEPKAEPTTKENVQMDGMAFKDLIEARRSVRQYAPSTITAAELEAIVTDALNAPSWKNTEVTRYYAAASDEMKQKILMDVLPGYNATSSAKAAALVVVTYKRGESGYSGDAPANELADTWGAYDAGLASAYFVLAARNRGWDTLIMGMRDEQKTRALWNIPANETILSVIAVGKTAQKYFKRPRKPVSEVLKVS